MPVRQDRDVAPVTPALKAAFDRTVTLPRWKTYLEAAGFREDKAMALYIWNAAIGQSFHYPLQALEVALRNVIHQSLTKRYGPDWWSAVPCREVLGSNRCEEIDKAARRIRSKYSIKPETDHIVASLMLGFWASLFKPEYNKPLWDHETKNALPHIGSNSIGTVSRAVNSIQNLRNRIFHHEPLIGRNLSEDYGTILKLLGWICPETREWVRHHASVPLVLRQKPR